MSDSSSANPPPASIASTLPNNNSSSVDGAPASKTQQQQQQHQTHSRPPKNESTEQWLSRVRQVQSSNVELAARVREVQEQSASRTMKAKKMAGVSHRTHNAKTSTYVAMSTASEALAPALGGGASAMMRRSHQGALLDNLFGSAAPSSSSAGGGGGASAPAPPPTAQKRQEAALKLMDQMDEDDEALAEAFAPVEREQMQAQMASAPVIAQRPDAWFGSSNAAGFGTTAGSARVQQQQQAIQASSHVNAVTGSEEQAALRLLQNAPKDDDEAASKFAIYEKFSDKLVVLRRDFDATVADSVEKDMPPMMRDDLRRLIASKLNSDRARGIHDESSNWFAYQMFVCASKNADSIAELSDDISARLRVLANNEDTCCPCCLMEYECDDDNDSDEQRVVKVVLPCAHTCCHTCWQHITQLRGQRATCMLCRAEVLVELLAANQ